MDKSIQGLFVGFISLILCVIWKLIMNHKKINDKVSRYEFNVVFVSSCLTILNYYFKL